MEPRGAVAFLPHYEPPRYAGDPRAYPLLLNTYKTMLHAEGRGGNQPHLRELTGLHVPDSWETWCEIHPGTARDLGIRDGDPVWVESPFGRIRVRARHYPGAMPGVVNVPFELGHRAYGRFARGVGANPNEILGNVVARLGGLSAWTSTRVRVHRA